MDKQKIKNFALKYPLLLSIYRNTIGKIRSKIVGTIQRNALQKNGFQIIQEIEKALYSTGVTYFVDCGTLLGLMREKKLIRHDLDMDYGIYFTDEFNIHDLDQIMMETGLKKHREFVYKGKTVEVSYSRGVTNIDFFVHEEVANKSFLYVFYKKEGEVYPSKNHYSVIRQERAHIEGFERVKINDLAVNIPKNYDEYLSSAYTENWRIPDPSWTYFMEPGFHELDGEYGLKVF